MREGCVMVFGALLMAASVVNYLIARRPETWEKWSARRQGRVPPFLRDSERAARLSRWWCTICFGVGAVIFIAAAVIGP